MFILVVLCVLVLLVGAAALVLHLMGRKLPVEHTAFAVVSIARPAAEVWAAIADISSQKDWMPGVSGVERIPDMNGHPAWKLKHGRHTLTIEEVVSEPPRRLIRNVAESRGVFSGSWEILIIPIPGVDGLACAKVRITERGKVHATVPRALMHMFGEDATIKKHLRALCARFGVAAVFSHD